jgi:broad specificity phosphatase PhoE
VEIAQRVHAAMATARAEARGHEAVLVSHQLPIWVARLNAEKRRYLHDPRRRECSLASVTSFEFDGDTLVTVSYAEPSRDLLPGAQKVAGA